jgi:hypothetical protein
VNDAQLESTNVVTPRTKPENEAERMDIATARAVAEFCTSQLRRHSKHLF